MPFQIIANKEDFAYIKAQTYIKEHITLHLEKQEYSDAPSARYAIEELKAHCKQNKTACPKLRIQKIVTAAWEEREAKRMQDGTYQPLPDWWLQAPWWQKSLPARKHYAHMSLEFKGKIAFTESPEKGDRDIQLSMSASAYLARFFSDDLSQRDIRDLGSLFQSGDFKLKFSSTPEDFERIYEAACDVQADGSAYESCMRYNRTHWEMGRHPAYVYGAGDLAIAWIENDDGEIFGRANVWPEKKTYVRVYGNSSISQNTMHSLLKAEGYKHVHGFSGARLLKIADSEDARSTNYIMPYIDGSSGTYVKEEGDFFILCNYEYEAYNLACGQTTEGSVTFWKQITCAKTGKTLNGRHATLVDGQFWSEQAIRNTQINYCDNLQGYTQEPVRMIYVNSERYSFRESHIATLNTFVCQKTRCLVQKVYGNEAIEVNTPRGVEIWSRSNTRNSWHREEDGTFWQRGYRAPTEATPPPEPAPTPARQESEGTSTFRYNQVDAYAYLTGSAIGRAWSQTTEDDRTF